MKVYGIEFHSYVDYNMFEGEWSSFESGHLFNSKEEAVKYLNEQGYELDKQSKKEEYAAGSGEYATILEKELNINNVSKLTKSKVLESLVECEKYYKDEIERLNGIIESLNKEKQLIRKHLQDGNYDLLKQYLMCDE